MDNILILGGGGFIGRNIVKSLSSSDFPENIGPVIISIHPDRWPFEYITETPLRVLMRVC